MHENKQGEKTVAECLTGDKIACQRITDYRQPANPLRSYFGNILCILIPDQPVATNRRGKKQPQQRHTAKPGKPAGTTKASQAKFTQ